MRHPSANGFSPNVWGKPLWKSLHVIAANFPLCPTKEQSKAYFNLFSSLCLTLPCKKCRRHFCRLVNSKNSVEKLTPALFKQRTSEPIGSARIRVARWLIRVHNKVNSRLGKVVRNVRYWEQYYERMRIRS